ncbi:nucleotidyltransferase family protein [Pedobacter aquatilis]|uniref:nucleotidyltransferase family protein n=1 Tax=Pedobacter aquatilis TaxID=351343 RepID=UPI00292FE38D|nr:nucleotidyltransferase family protein [Pedobacter aquatilis]
MGTAIIILAAGNSSRMGKPKQLLTYNGKTLLDIAITESLKTTFCPVVVVLGAYAEEIKKHSQNPQVCYCINESWDQGMSSSIKAGLKYSIENDENIENVIIAVADQVHLSCEILSALEEKLRSSGKGIVTSSYSGISGTPSLFSRKYFGELLNLVGQSGAKKIIEANAGDTTTISFDQGVIDIDTPADYNKLINNK